MIPRPAGKSSPVVALTMLGLAEDSMTGGGPHWWPLSSTQGEVGGLLSLSLSSGCCGCKKGLHGSTRNGTGRPSKLSDRLVKRGENLMMAEWSVTYEDIHIERVKPIATYRVPVQLLACRHLTHCIHTSRPPFL